MTRRTRDEVSNSDSWYLNQLFRHHSLVVMFFVASLLSLWLLFNYYTRADTVVAPIVQTQPVLVDENGESRTVPVLQRYSQSTGPIRIGIIAGHMGSDSGAVCDDGLQEVSLNVDIANQVITQLRARGFEVELLNEFDDRLAGYEANGLVSIHADSCVGPAVDLSGYKTASSSQNPSSVILEQCMVQRYGDWTQLAFSSNTITSHMTNYHVFGEISPATPAMIIETGFMGRDRELLTTYSDRPATAIAEGIVCFVERTQ